MDTASSSAPKIPSIRTYAKDLEITRKEKGLPPEAVIAVEEPKAKAPTAKVTEKKVAPRPKVTLFKRASKAEVEKPVVAPLPPLSSIPKKTAPIPKIIASPVRETSFIVDNEDAAAATIITDTKRDRFKLLPAMITSIKSWFSEKKKSYAAKKAPKYTVPETTRRKGVIQKATSNTGKFTNSDFESIQERIRQRKEAEDKPESHTTWSANTEPGYLLLEGETIKPKVANVQVVARKSYRAVPAPVVAPIVVPVVLPEPEPIPITPKPEPPVEETKPVTSEQTQEVVAQIPQRENVPEVTTPRQKTNLLQIQTNLLALGFSGLLIALALFGTYAYFIFNTEEPTVISSATTPLSQLLSESTFVALPLEEVTEDSITRSLGEAKTGSDLIETVFTYRSTGEAVPPTLLFSGLNITLPRDFIQTISTARFGYISENPYMLFTIKDETAARGGLLTWEENLYLDLRNVFSTTIMPEDSLPNFIDASQSGVDVRVLKHQNGQELMLYGIVGKTVIITTGSAPFASLMNQIK
jgi:hypothetical protein